MNFFFLFLMLPVFSQSFDWEGHRGSRGLMPENTIEAMREALLYPVTTLEMDVVISKDKKVVVSHDHWMSPEFCLHPEGKTFKDEEIKIYKMNYSEILRFDCGSIPHPRFPEQKKMSVGKPLLRTLLTDIEETLKKEKRSILYNIEIKSDVEDEKKGLQPPVKLFSDLVITTIRGILPENRFVIQSFDPRVLKYVREKYPNITLSFLSEDVRRLPADVKNALGFFPQIFSPDQTFLTYEDIPLFHAEGMRVIPWTVNTKEDMKKLMAMGVDGIITDYPNLIPEVLAKVCPEKTHLFEGNCISIPTHALPSDKNPGWNCKDGYIQRRFHCDRIKVPAHAVLLPDGKSWECKENYRRYRERCEKK